MKCETQPAKTVSKRAVVYIVIANAVMAYVVMAYVVMACAVMAYVGVAYVVMACTAMAYVVMASRAFAAWKNRHCVVWCLSANNAAHA